MYTKTKINNLTKNNKILYEKDGWKLTAIYDYEGLIGEAIFNNHFTRTCLRKKEIFFRLTNFSLTSKTIKHKKLLPISLIDVIKYKILIPIILKKLPKHEILSLIDALHEEKLHLIDVIKYKILIPIILKKLPKHEILLPVYILKNEKLEYFRQIERTNYEIKVYDQLNAPTWIRNKDIPSDIRTILSFFNFKNDNIVFLNEEKFLKKEKNVEIYKIKNVYNSNTFKFKNGNDYFILSEHVLVNNINKNKDLLLILLAKLKHYKYKGNKSINKIIHEIFENKHIILL